ncbi:hypothetical protein SAMN06309944_1502 [Micrococcales bacterium KH10]|nr:hypothetical protein SAMN06309944_1502 [Micrococcales bacterium KH10]
MSGEHDQPATPLSKSVARRWRRPGPPLGRSRPPLIGSVALAATRFVGGMGRPVMVRRMLAGPSGQAVAQAPTGAAIGVTQVQPPRWWSESAVFAQERAADQEAAVSQDARRGLPRVVTPMPAPSDARPQGAWVTTAPKVIPMRLPHEVAAVGKLTTGADTAPRRVLRKDSSEGISRGAGQASSTSGTLASDVPAPQDLSTSSPSPANSVAPLQTQAVDAVGVRSAAPKASSRPAPPAGRLLRRKIAAGRAVAAATMESPARRSSDSIRRSTDPIRRSSPSRPEPVEQQSVGTAVPTLRPAQNGALRPAQNGALRPAQGTGRENSLIEPVEITAQSTHQPAGDSADSAQRHREATTASDAPIRRSSGSTHRSNLSRPESVEQQSASAAVSTSSTQRVSALRQAQGTGRENSLIQPVEITGSAPTPLPLATARPHQNTARTAAATATPWYAPAAALRSKPQAEHSVHTPAPVAGSTPAAIRRSSATSNAATQVPTPPLDNATATAAVATVRNETTATMPSPVGQRRAATTNASSSERTAPALAASASTTSVAPPVLAASASAAAAKPVPPQHPTVRRFSTGRLPGGGHHRSHATKGEAKPLVASAGQRSSLVHAEPGLDASWVHGGTSWLSDPQAPVRRSVVPGAVSPGLAAVAARTAQPHASAIAALSQPEVRSSARHQGRPNARPINAPADFDDVAPPAADPVLRLRNAAGNVASGLPAAAIGDQATVTRAFQGNLGRGRSAVLRRHLAEPSRAGQASGIGDAPGVNRAFGTSAAPGAGAATSPASAATATPVPRSGSDAASANAANSAVAHPPVRRLSASRTGSHDISVPTPWQLAPPRTIIRQDPPARPQTTPPGAASSSPIRRSTAGSSPAATTQAADRQRGNARPTGNPSVHDPYAPIVRRWNANRPTDHNLGGNMSPNELSGQLDAMQQNFAAQAGGAFGSGAASPTGDGADAASLMAVVSRYVGPMVDAHMDDVLESRVRRIVDERIQAETERRAWRSDPGVF